MLKLHLVQAEHGACLIVEHGTSSNPRYILIDGGPATMRQLVEEYAPVEYDYRLVEMGPHEHTMPLDRAA